MKAKILKRFEEEVAGLERELKMELPKEIQRARELGDLRENAEYQAAKERQTYVQARIGMLRRRMNEIALMNMEKIPHGKAGFGSTVTLREIDRPAADLPAGHARGRRWREGPDLDRSPIGRALLNREEGDEVSVATPAAPASSRSSSW